MPFGQLELEHVVRVGAVDGQRGPGLLDEVRQPQIDVGRRAGEFQVVTRAGRDEEVGAAGARTIRQSENGGLRRVEQLDRRAGRARAAQFDRQEAVVSRVEAVPEVAGHRVLIHQVVAEVDRAEVVDNVDRLGNHRRATVVVSNGRQDREPAAARVKVGRLERAGRLVDRRGGDLPVAPGDRDRVGVEHAGIAEAAGDDDRAGADQHLAVDGDRGADLKSAGHRVDVAHGDGRRGQVLHARLVGDPEGDRPHAVVSERDHRLSPLASTWNTPPS